VSGSRAHEPWPKEASARDLRLMSTARQWVFVLHIGGVSVKCYNGCWPEQVEGRRHGGGCAKTRQKATHLCAQKSVV
jgi:hypothetical protein